MTGFLAPPGSPSAVGPAGSAKVVVRSAAASVVLGAGGGWIADDQAGTLRPFDPGSGTLSARAVHVGGAPISIASGYGKLWVADISENLLYAVNLANHKVTGSPISVSQGPVSVATGDGGVWVASLLSGTVGLIDPKTEQVKASVALPDGAVRIALGDGYVWVTGQTDTLTRIDPRPSGVTLRWRETKVGQGPIGVAVGGGAVWVANAESGTVSEVDPRTMSVVGGFRVPSGSSSTSSSGSDPQTLSVWQGRVWVGLGSRPALLAFDPRSRTESGKAVQLPGVARDLYVSDDGGLWATTANPGTVLQISAG
ncbi:MAG: hypothetical protein ACRDV4_07730 [Acidimicrobiales bacterium]